MNPELARNDNITAVVAGVVIGLIGLAVYLIGNQRTAGRRQSSARRAITLGKLPERDRLSPGRTMRYMAGGTIVAVIIASAIVPFFTGITLVDPDGRKHLASPSEYFATLKQMAIGLLCLGIQLGMVLTAIAWIVSRFKDRALLVAFHKYKAGDHNTAQDELRKAHEQQPTPERANTLAAWMIVERRFPEAYKLLLQAEDLGCDPKLTRVNMATCLCGMGRPEDGLKKLEGSLSSPKSDFFEVLQYTACLTACRRAEEAWWGLDCVERMYPNLPSSLRKTVRPQIDALRTELGALIEGKKLPPFDEI